MTMEFAWPYAFLLLLLPLLLRFIPSSRKADDRLAIAVSSHLAAALDAASGGPQRVAFDWRRLLGWIAWAALVAALAQPWWRSGEEIRLASGRSIILAIDLSGSMEKRDLVLDGQAIDRLGAVKTVARDFVARRQGDRIGLVLYGDEAFLASPLTFDTVAVANAIAEAAIGMAGRTTAIGDALGLAIVKLREDPAREKTIVLLSDGTNNAGTAEPEDAAELARQFGIRVHTIGLGSQSALNGAPAIDPSADLDTETLEAVANAAGGGFFRAATLDELRDVYAEIAEIEVNESETPPLAQRRDLQAVPLSILLAALIALGFPAIGRRRPV